MKTSSHRKRIGEDEGGPEDGFKEDGGEDSKAAQTAELPSRPKGGCAKGNQEEEEIEAKASPKKTGAKKKD